MNKKLFASRGVSRNVPQADTRNAAGGVAYSLSNEAALAQYAVTGTFQDTYYVGATDHLTKVEDLVASCRPEFIAKLAVYAREQGKMKDMPAYLLATLVSRGETELAKRIFDRVCNNSKVLLVFARIIRSGATGRSSFGTATKKLIQNWINKKGDKGLYLSSVGHSDPSMADLIKMVHPKPVSDSQSEMFSYLLGKKYNLELLPQDIQMFERLKKGEGTEVPDLPFRALTNCELNEAQWRGIAKNMPWNTLRQSLNLLERRGVFKNNKAVREAAEKLADPENVSKFNAFPFELMATWKATEHTDIPIEIRNAIQVAMEAATQNVPVLHGKTLIAVDVSGSMGGCPITGRGAKPSIITAVEGAALIACSLLRNNKSASLIGFDMAGRHYGIGSHSFTSNVEGVYEMDVNPFDSVLTNARRISLNGGGTDVSLPFQYLLKNKMKVDNIVLLSDNESWTSSHYNGFRGSSVGAPACAAWMEYSRKNRQTKLACVDLCPGDTSQVPDQQGRVMNVAGFSDVIFGNISEFFSRDSNVNFVDIVGRTEI